VGGLATPSAAESFAAAPAATGAGGWAASASASAVFALLARVDRVRGAVLVRVRRRVVGGAGSSAAGSPEGPPASPAGSASPGAGTAPGCSGGGPAARPAARRRRGAGRVVSISVWVVSSSSGTG
jgi:hypothetical protein